MRFTLAVVIAILVAVVLIMAVAVKTRSVIDQAIVNEGFYTQYAREEPTRSDVPYTGTVPYGAWGTQPWAEAYPVASRSPSSYPSARDMTVGTDFA